MAYKIFMVIAGLVWMFLAYQVALTSYSPSRLDRALIGFGLFMIGLLVAMNPWTIG